ncbi:DUF3800 domain-containing protein [Saccharolobus shibatae]|uniref:DUF3800 domain-containing protein n=1 Tax=Saccharolobus shibatae TaxID=2286 RepID=A0A8F5BYR5_9CREN|nr:DUF3800 domain-containing protein [Saccharolobus shibatae]QXJ33836.1 hypothetical protein J5U22_00381 [Saccharolobus shibatae]
MLLVFIDENGKPTFKEIDKQGRPLPFIVTSIIVRDTELSIIKNRIAFLKAKYGIPNLEIHASDLFHPKSNFPLTESQIRNFAEEFAEIIKDLNIVIISSVVFKKYRTVSKPIKSTVDKKLRKDVISIGYRHLFERIIRFAEKNYPNEWILFIHDQISVSKDSQLSTEQKEIIETMNNELDNNPYIRRSPIVERVFKPIYFANSSQYDVLQISDFAGYIIRKHILNEKGNKFNYERLFEIISSKLDKNPKNGKIEGWGIKSWDYYA